MNVHRQDARYLCPADLLQRAFDKNYPDVEGEIFCEGSEVVDGKPYWAFDNYRNNGLGSELRPRPLFYTQSGWTSNFASEYGMENIKCITYACDPVLHRNTGVKKTYDIGFIGNYDDPTGQRQEQLEFLHKHYKVFSSDTVGADDMADAYSRCRVIFNHIRYEEINIRFFEGLAMGAQVVSYMPSLHLYAEEGQDYLTYHSTDDLKEKIDYLLENPDKRLAMSRSARTRAVSQHTYKHRADEMLLFLKQKNYVYTEN